MATVHAQEPSIHLAVTVTPSFSSPPSPTLTNPDVIPPAQSSLYATSSISPAHSQTDLRNTSTYGGSPASSRHQRSDSDASVVTELGVATVMPVIVQAAQAIPVTTTRQSIYQGYEHGAPLSDIGEEESEIDGTETPRHHTPTPAPAPRSEPDSDPGAESNLPKSAGAPPLRHKKRLSNMSSSSGGSDSTEWDKFDVSKLGSDRVAADIQQARGDVADDDAASTRTTSKEGDEELAVLNDRAEQILENARKRLSSMEDNLSKARHSIQLSSTKSSPNMHDLGVTHQPAGELYRSISQSAAHRKPRAMFPTAMSLQHVRTGSDNTMPTGMKRLSKTPEVRSASALEFARPRLGVVTPETNRILAHSPASSRSHNSSLRMLTEEGDPNTPSTVRTSPDAPDSAGPVHRGLGIHPSGTHGQEDLTQFSSQDSFGTPTSVERSSSQASTRSARDLRDQMSGMKNRIAELKSKAQADSLRRRSLQNLKSPSLFSNASASSSKPEKWSSPAPTHDDESAGPSHQNQAIYWPSVPSHHHHHHHHRRKDSALDESRAGPVVPSPDPVTPQPARFLAVDEHTPADPASTRTDKNTPSLARRVHEADQGTEIDDDDIESMIQPSTYEDAEQVLDASDVEDGVAPSEEEQIYLNEVLEESLHDVEPDVPAIPGSFLTGELSPDGQTELSHEDRLDAFDYENMFLHSAMGNYQAGSESEDSDSDSVETSRRELHTPTMEHEEELDIYDDGDDVDDDTRIASDQADEGSTDKPTGGQTDGETLHAAPRQSPNPERDPVDDTMDTPTQDDLKAPVKPWIKATRSNSIESASSVATFQTATEGGNVDPDEDSDEVPNEILNWGVTPTPHEHVESDSDATPGDLEHEWPQPPSGVQRNSRHQRHDSGAGSVSMSGSSRRSHDGGINGHTRTVSGTVQPIASSPTIPSPRQATTHHSQYALSRRSIDIGSEDQRTPQATAFPAYVHSSPRAVQVRLDSPSQMVFSTHSRQPSSFSRTMPIGRPETASTARSTPSARHQSQTTPSVVSTASSNHPANTEVLMESLIKLADPEFVIEPGTRFAEVDKELVLSLLRTVGSAVDGILRARKYRDDRMVEELRGRLADSSVVLSRGLYARDSSAEEIDDDDDDEDHESEELIGEPGPSEEEDDEEDEEELERILYELEHKQHQTRPRDEDADSEVLPLH